MNQLRRAAAEVSKLLDSYAARIEQRRYSPDSETPDSSLLTPNSETPDSETPPLFQRYREKLKTLQTTRC